MTTATDAVVSFETDVPTVRETLPLSLAGSGEPTRTGVCRGGASSPPPSPCACARPWAWPPGAPAAPRGA